MRRDNLSAEVRSRLHRLPGEYSSHYGVLPPNPTEDAVAIGSAINSMERAMEALAEAEVMAKTLRDPFLMSRVLTRKEAVSSSSIEGTHSTLDELLALEETSDESAAPEVKQVRDYAVVLENMLPRASASGPDIFSRDLIKELHRSAMRSDKDYQDIPGEFRQRVVWIGGDGHIASSIYNPPAPAFVEECVAEHVDYLRCEGMQSMTQGIVTRMALAHAHFEAIHPFRDGNGRVGRLLLPLMMAADGRTPLYLSAYIEANKDHYYEALKAAQQRLHYPALIGFLSEAIIGTVAEIKRTRASLIALQRDWRGRRTFRANSAADAAVGILHEYPVVSVRRLQALLGVSFPAASQAVQQLTEVGILEERTGYRRNRLFVAPEAIRILNRPFGSQDDLDETPDHEDGVLFRP